MPRWLGRTPRRGGRCSRYRDHQLLAERMWELRANLTAYDAAYVALGELLDASVVTTDARLARAPDNRARVDLVGGNRT